MQRTLLALALIASAGASVSYAQAQTYAQPQPMPPQAMPSNEPLDPYGHPLIGRNDWVAQPGDRTNAGAARPVHHNRMDSDMAQAPQAMPMQSGPHQTAFRDEYGFRYDAQGNRLDARGNVISPQTR
ncbi:MAG TPA: hypothetical protein VG224_26130 [Reyranella sp.]|jgi:hypothetical protein|nr:hypothetical protein [Reyranella sp.]